MSRKERANTVAIGTTTDARSLFAVNRDATSLLSMARSTGNASYDPTSAITFYYNQGRNELAANSFIVPITTGLLGVTLPRWAAGQAAE